MPVLSTFPEDGFPRIFSLGREHFRGAFGRAAQFIPCRVGPWPELAGEVDASADLPRNHHSGFAPALIHAAMTARSWSVMPVALPSGMMRVTTTCW